MRNGGSGAFAGPSPRRRTVEPARVALLHPVRPVSAGILDRPRSMPADHAHRGLRRGCSEVRRLTPADTGPPFADVHSGIRRGATGSLPDTIILPECVIGSTVADAQAGTGRRTERWITHRWHLTVPGAASVGCEIRVGVAAARPNGQLRGHPVRVLADSAPGPPGIIPFRLGAIARGRSAVRTTTAHRSRDRFARQAPDSNGWWRARGRQAAVQPVRTHSGPAGEHR